MKEEAKQLAEIASNQPKTGSLLAAAMAWINAHWVDWGQPLIQMFTSIAGLVLVVMLIRKHYTEEKLARKKLKEENNE